MFKQFFKKSNKSVVFGKFLKQQTKQKIIC